MGKCKYVLGILLMMCCLFLSKCEQHVQAAGGNFDAPPALTLGAENAIADNETVYYRMDISEAGKYIIEGSMRRFSYTLYDGQVQEIKTNHFCSTSSITCSGDVFVFDAPGTYYLYFWAENAGTLSVRKADIPKIVMGSTASDSVQANRISFFEFTPTESGTYSFYFTSPGYTQVERLGGMSASSWKGETNYYQALTANETYYFLLRNEETATVTVTVKKEPSVVEMSVSAPLRTTCYRCFDYWGFETCCKFFLKLSDGTEVTTTYSNPEDRDKYGLNVKLYTKDGTELIYGLGYDGPVGEYYVILSAGDKVSAPIYFYQKDIADCELVMKNGTILSGLAGDAERYRYQDGAHVVKLVAEESGWYVLRAGENSYIDVYDNQLKRVSEREEARPFDAEAPGVYYAFVGAQEEFNAEFLKIEKLSELKIADNCRQVYYRSAGENYFDKIVEGIRFTGITENGTELSFSYRNDNWINYGMWYELKYSGGMLPPSAELPVGNYILKVTDWSGNYTCEIPFVINETGTAPETETPKYNGIVLQKGEYYYYVDGVVDASYNGLAFYNEEWWYVSQGKIDFTYGGLVFFNDTWWYLKNGKVNFNYNGLAYVNDKWWYVVTGHIDFNYDGLVFYNDDWWFVQNGCVNFGYTGLAYVNGDWWYVVNGKIDFTYCGLIDYNEESWYVQGGRIDFDYNNVYYYNDTWWYVEVGKINFDYTGLAYTAFNDKWWYVINGVISFDYTGAAYANEKYWYVEKGEIDFKRVGKITVDGAERDVAYGEILNMS